MSFDLDPPEVVRQTTIDLTWGPMLVYAHADHRSVTFVDQGVVDDPRDRAVCKALLQHALKLIEEEENGQG